MNAGQSPQPRPRGRPALPEGQGKRYPLGIRTTKALKDQLDQAAETAGRSIAQEIEFRLEQSFEDEFVWGDLRRAAVFRAMAALAIFEVGPDYDWLSDYAAFNAVTDRWQRLFDEISPEPPDKARRQIDKWRATAKRIVDDEDLPSDRRDRLIRAAEHATRNTLISKALRDELARAADAARDKWGLR